MLRIIFYAFIYVSLISCAIEVNSEMINKANFKPKPSDKEAIELIKNYLEGVLIDPDSLRITCDTAKKGWGRQIEIDEPAFGYLVFCKVNAKNRLGGYTGNKEQLFVINGSELASFDYTGYVNDGKGIRFDFIE